MYFVYKLDIPVYANFRKRQSYAIRPALNACELCEGASFHSELASRFLFRCSSQYQALVFFLPVHHVNQQAASVVARSSRAQQSFATLGVQVTRVGGPPGCILER